MSTSGPARVQRPAPHFEGTAVIDGTFEGMLSRFKGLLGYRPLTCVFSLPAELSLTTYTSTKQWLVLAFIPMAWTFVCPTEIIAFSDAAAKFRERGAQVVFASTDSEYSLLAWSNTARKDGGLGHIQIPLLSDKNHSLSRNYGVLLEDEGIALRGLFIIDPHGIVRQV